MKILRAKPILKTVYRRESQSRQENVRRLLRYDFLNIIRNANGVPTVSPEKRDKDGVKSKSGMKNESNSTVREFKIRHGLPQPTMNYNPSRELLTKERVPLNYRSLSTIMQSQSNPIRSRSGSLNRTYQQHPTQRVHSQRLFPQRSNHRSPGQPVRGYIRAGEDDYNFIRRRSTPNYLTKKLL